MKTETAAGAPAKLPTAYRPVAVELAKETNLEGALLEKRMRPLEAAHALGAHVDAICSIIKAQEGAAEVLGKELQPLQARKRVIASVAARLRDYLVEWMRRAKHTTVKGELHSVSLQTKAGFACDDPAALPKRFRLVETKLNVKALEAALAAGEDLPEGVQKIETDYVVIR